MTGLRRLMARRSLLTGSGFLLLSGCKTTELASALELMSSLGTSASGSGGLTSAEIAQGLKQALSVGTARTVQRVGRKDGYFRDAAIHIFLPDELRDVQETLRFFGLSALVDDVELKLNRAAEQAAEKTKPIFLSAIARMTLQDVIGIWKGPEDAATRYFQRTTTPALRREIAPVVDRSLNAVGALKAYETMMGEYRRLPLVPDVRAELRAHALDRSVAGLFHYVAREEAEIRRNPAARSTELLRRVFA